MKSRQSVIIAGGGWAGLATALELTSHQVPVRLFESAPQLGGRARNVPFGELTVDNGQHLLIGAYSETLRLLELIGAVESELFLRTRLRLKVVEGEEALVMQAPPLPAPLHLAWAQLSAEGLTIKERTTALLMSLRLTLSNFSLRNDISVAELLHRHHQGDTITRRFWEPLCIATLNTPITRASAQVFLRVLKDSFTHRRHDADLLIPRELLGDLFPERVADYLKTRRVTIETRHRLEALEIINEKLDSITVCGETIACNHLVIATSPHAAAKLIKGHKSLAPLQKQITGLGSQPITTLYLQYQTGHRLEEPIIGMSGTISQWLFDRHECGQPGLIAVVISAEGEHDHWDNATLTSQVIKEIRQQFPHWPEPLQSRIIRERRATFECCVGIESRRPGNTTPVEGLWLAGDYTDTGYPATLEGAVRSGITCAQRIIAKIGKGYSPNGVGKSA